MLTKSPRYGLALVVVSVLGLLSAQAYGHPVDTLRKTTSGLSIRTNLLWAATAEPNVGVEFPVGEHWTVGGNFGFKAWPRWAPWDWDTENNLSHWRNFAVVPEARYYFNQVYQGFFTGADFLYTHFNVGSVDIPLYPEVSDFRDQGSYWAGGWFLGYAWWPWQHFRLELEAGASVGLAAYDRYDCPHCGTRLAQERKVAVVPKLAINLAWNPVSRDEEARRKVNRVRLSAGTDTLSVLTPPVAFVVHLKEVQELQSVGDRLSASCPWVIPIDQYRPFDYLTRPGWDSVEYIRFDVDSDALEMSLSDNAERLKGLLRTIEALRKDRRNDELLVSIIGLASIEGPSVHNDSLSVRRARMVASYLQRKSGLEHRHFEVIGKGEAWDWFRQQLENHGEEYARLLDTLYAQPDPDVREQLLKASPTLYRQIKEDFLEDQRSAGYIRVYYGNASDPVTKQWNGPIAGMILAKRYAAAVSAIEQDPAVLERVESDAEALNAYAIALYFSALDNTDPETEARALELLSKAARMGSDAAQENLEGAHVYGPARREYEAWKEALSK